MEHESGCHGTLPFRAVRRVPRLETKSEVSPHHELVRRRSVQAVSRNTARDRLLLRAAKRLPHPPVLRQLCLPVSVPCRVMILLSHHVRSHDRRIRILLCYRILMRQRTTKRVSCPPASLLRIFRRIRTTSENNATVNRRRHNRSARRNNLSHPVQASWPRRFAQTSLRQRVPRNLSVTVALNSVVCVGLVVRVWSPRVTQSSSGRHYKQQS